MRGLICTSGSYDMHAHVKGPAHFKIRELVAKENNSGDIAAWDNPEVLHMYIVGYHASVTTSRC